MKQGRSQGCTIWRFKVEESESLLLNKADTCADPEGGGAGGPDNPLKNHINIGFLSNTGPDPLKKSQNFQASIECWGIIGTPAKRHLNGVSLAGRRWPVLSDIWILPLSN